MMTARLVGRIVIGGIFALGASAVRAESKGCAQIQAASDEAGGALSAEELAKKVGTDIETVRNCLDAKAKVPKPHDVTPPPTK